MNDLDNLVAAIQSGAIPLAVGLVLTLLVRLGKHPLLSVQWNRVPAYARPFVPAILGGLGAAGEALVSGRPWPQAIIAAVLMGGPGFLLALPSPVVPTVTVAPDPAGSTTHVTITRGQP